MQHQTDPFLDKARESLAGAESEFVNKRLSVDQALAVAPRMHEALEELKHMLRQRYPDATFRVARSPENPETVLLKPVVDVADRDEVMDVVIDRLIELQSVEQLPLFVVPVRTPERNEAIRQAM
jgi:hypothetical protein